MTLVAPSVKPARTGAATPAATTAPASAAAPIPFIRATRKQSTNVTTLLTNALTAAQIPLQPTQVRPSGFLARIKVLVTATTAGNSAAVAFQADAPWNILQNVSFSSPAGDILLNPIDGFALNELFKLGAFASGSRDAMTLPSFKVVTGAVATGGSFQFETEIPVELDSRDAFGAIQNMNAAEQFVLQLTLNTLPAIYSTAPTTAPSVTITAVMEYYSQPSAGTAAAPQSTAPIGNGTLSIIQSQTVNIAPGATGRTQIVNTGTVLRGIIFILRTAAGVRTEADWPAIVSFYLNNQQIFYKPLPLWRDQQSIEYRLTGQPVSAPTAFAPDNGVQVLTDFMNFGSSGGMKVDGTSNRNQWLATGKGTDLEIEATTAWGASGATLQIITLGVRPINAQALYAPEPY